MKIIFPIRDLDAFLNHSVKLKPPIGDIDVDECFATSTLREQPSRRHSSSQAAKHARGA